MYLQKINSRSQKYFPPAKLSTEGGSETFIYIQIIFLCLPSLKDTRLGATTERWGFQYQESRKPS